MHSRSVGRTVLCATVPCLIGVWFVLTPAGAVPFAKICEIFGVSTPAAVQDALQALDKCATLVQGCWVCKRYLHARVHSRVHDTSIHTCCTCMHACTDTCKHTLTQTQHVN